MADNLTAGLTESNGSLPHPSVHTYATACVLDLLLYTFKHLLFYSFSLFNFRLLAVFFTCFVKVLPRVGSGAVRIDPL